MGKYELSISPDYVPDWGIVDAIRELFQNALDQQTVEPDNEMFFSYDYETETLTLGNNKSILTVNTLLLGVSSKVDSKETIGKFGEGYKIATLVLCRLGRKITFFNYGAREVWKPRLVKSRRYQSDVLTFFVEKSNIWTGVPDHNLTIEVSGITIDDYRSICESNLHLTKQDADFVIDNRLGRILLDPKHQGKVFVNGLYICKYAEFDYGYDFKPEYVTLDRSRKLVSDFNLRWSSSKMWASVGTDKLTELAKKGSKDVEYIDSPNSWQLQDNWPTTCENAYDSFVSENGEKAVPVTNQAEFEQVPKSYKAIFVTMPYQKMLTASSKYANVPFEEEPDYVVELTKWFDDIKENCTTEQIAKFEFLVENIKAKLE